MANLAPKNSVWSAMEYKPPRGRCNFKPSILSTCPCLRFMLHPVKAATSFECDGCGHHASFHSLENDAEDAVLQKWSAQEARDLDAQRAGSVSKKRRRIADKASETVEILELPDDGDISVVLGCSNRKRHAKQTQAMRSGPSKNGHSAVE
ncbi:Hypothetical predicted protein [Lecanosticta acicola]|uniref:Uncharacterized protein n=1 Tax=Lecanosticta acicola TaxID=111012 RepID=A0AAI8Z6H3_9PEZI|nr:Hypothetical predicted protein [Lecanosticta acicola]